MTDATERSDERRVVGGAEARFPRIDLINLRVLEVLVTDLSTGYARRTYHEQRHRATDLERSSERIDDRALRFRQRIESAG